MVWLLTSVAIAEEVLVKLYVEPSTAEVTVQPGNQTYPTGPPFLVSVHDSSRPVEFTLRAPGYVPMVLTLTGSDLLGAKRLPPEGTYRLSRPWPKWVFLLLLPLAGALIARRRLAANGPPAPTNPDPAPYRLEQEIAEGGMAKVYRGTSTKVPGSKVAIKVVRPELVEDPDTKKRFLREIEICSRLKHPHLTTVYDSGTAPNGDLFLVMELLDGVTLAEELDVDPQPCKTKIASILLPLCQALQSIHREGLVHRDVKPSNIFLDKIAGVKLVDLGIARGLDFEAVTRTGMAVGSPHYMAPEQAKGDVRPENDQYSVGVLLFEMLAGQRPFPKGDPIEVITQHLTAPIPSLGKLAPEATPLLESVVQRLMNKRPEGRFASMAEAAAAIESALKDQDISHDDATCGVVIAPS